MKAVFPMLFLLCFSLVLMGQDPLLNPDKRHELGTSIQGILGTQNGGYGLTYRYHFKRSAFRAGINLFGHNEGAELAISSDNQSDEQARYFSINSRFGYEGHIWLTSNWMAYIGGDLLASFARNNQEATQTTASATSERILDSRATRLGIAPVVGLRFQISPVVSVGTELRYVGRVTFSNTESTNRVTGREDVIRNESNTRVDHYFENPAVLYLQINL